MLEQKQKASVLPIAISKNMEESLLPKRGFLEIMLLLIIVIKSM